MCVCIYNVYIYIHRYVYLDLDNTVVAGEEGRAEGRRHVIHHHVSCIFLPLVQVVRNRRRGLHEASNRLFHVLDLYWRRLKSSCLWSKSRRLKTMIWSTTCHTPPCFVHPLAACPSCTQSPPRSAIEESNRFVQALDLYSRRLESSCLWCKSSHSKTTNWSTI